jgi:iron complex outermembrane receptor protein
MKPVVITGSLIPTAETVGPAPVQTIGAAEIQRAGSQDVLDLVKKLSTSFSGNGNVGQTVNNGGFGEANVQIRNLPTLVMLNGRRVGKSAFSNGGLVDLNTIPISMIDKIEILKDGASALYGSEAIGGVVNIITKKDFDGTEISGRYGFATEKGDVTEQRASVISGITTEHGSFVGGGQYYYMDPLITSDRDVPSLSRKQLMSMGIDPAASSYFSPSYPGKVQGQHANGSSARYVLANSPFLGPQSPTGSPAPGYNPNLMGGPNGATPGSPPVFAGQTFTGPGAIDAYNAYAIAHGYVDPTDTGHGPYVPITSAGLLNTALFPGHASILSQDRRQAFASGEHDLFDKQMQIFGQFLYANTESIGGLAPSPVIGLDPINSDINVPANNPYNPFGVALGPDGVPGNLTYNRVRSRFIQSGPRIFDNQTDFYHVVAGLKGEFDNGYAYNAAYTYNQGDQIQFTRNAINGAALDAALKPNTDPALAAQGLSTLRDSNGNLVPMYNIFFSPTANYPTSMGPNSQATIRAISTSLFEVGKSTEWDADGTITGKPFDLPGGKFGFAVGGGYRSESLSIDFDGLTRIGKVPGLNAQAPTSGRRNSWDGFAEINIPFVSPDMNVPGFHSLEVTAAGRYENFDPGGDSAVPKVGLRWQPYDEQVTLRATYSQSFVAPTTFQLFGGAAQNNPTLNFPDGTIQATTRNVSNPDLHPVDAENYGAGIVVTPKLVPGLTVSADYFHVKTEKDIFRLSEQAILNDLNAKGSGSVYAPLYRDINGNPLTTTTPGQVTTTSYGTMSVPFANGATTETHGLDLTANYQLPLDPEVFGKINVFVNSTVTFDYLYDDPTVHTITLINPDTGNPFPDNRRVHGPYHYEGQYTDRNNGIAGGQGLIPDWSIATGLTWDYQDFTYTINARYIPEVQDQGDAFGSVSTVDNMGHPYNDYTLNNKPWTIESWYTIDMQLAYHFGQKWPKWLDGTRLAIGCNNITDNAPPVIASSFEDNTDKSTYDILGRFIYFEVSKKF